MEETRATPRATAPRQRRRPQISCTECRRRKQKVCESDAKNTPCTAEEPGLRDNTMQCAPRADGPCEHCLRRYPPVECYVDVNAHRREGRPYQASGITAPAGNVRPLETVFAFPGSDQAIPPSHEGLMGLNSEPSALAFIVDFASNPGHLLEDHTKKQNKHHPPSQDNETILLACKDPVAILPNTSQLENSHARTEFVTNIYRVVHHGLSPSSQVMGGIITAVNNSLTNVPIEPTLRNAELFHFFHQRVTASMTSINESSTPQIFLETILPWMLQSHLMPHIAILMASAKQSAENDVCADKKSETRLVKSKVLGLFKNFLTSDFRIVGNAAIKAIVPLITTELLWGQIDSLWVHMKGLKQMIDLQGGLAWLTDPVLQQALVVTDYQLACYLEQDVFLQTTKEATDRVVEISPSYNVRLCSPLVEYPRQFSDIRSEFGLDLWTAELLDDVRFLTLSILNADESEERTVKVRATAKWLHKCIASFKPPSVASVSEPYIGISHIIRLAAKIYTSSIASMTPISKDLTPQSHSELHALMASVSEEVWESLPGVWYWILLVACPSGEKLGHEGRTANEMARWLRRKMAVAGMAIALEDFGLGTLMAQRFWLIQQRIKTETAT